MDYDLYVGNGFDAGRFITRASGRGLGTGNRDFYGPIWAHKSLDFQETLRYINNSTVSVER
jgi:hypothetical protein